MMKQSPIDQYTKSLHEGIAEKILRTLFFHKLKPVLNKVEKELDDPELSAQLETIRYAVKNFETTLKNLCKRRPNDFRCKDKKW